MPSGLEQGSCHGGASADHAQPRIGPCHLAPVTPLRLVTNAVSQRCESMPQRQAAMSIGLGGGKHLRMPARASQGGA
jgi:hypothetical protein